MKANDNTFTEGNYGVYKFQVTHHNLTQKQSQAIWGRLKARRRKLYYSSAKKCEYVYTLENGIEIFFRTHKSHILHIDVVVFPQMVLHKKGSPFIMFGSTMSLWSLEEKINTAITRELGPDYTVDKFVMTEVECGVDIILPEKISAEYFISLIERSILLTEHDHVVNLNTYENGKRMKDKHGFGLDTERMIFTVNDKFFRSEYGFEINCNMPEAWVRFRIGLSNKAINQAVKNNRLCGVMAVLTCFVESSKNIINDFVSKHFPVGEYYSYKLMKQVIDESGLPPKLRMKMQLCADYFHSHRNIKGFNKEMEKLFTRGTRLEVLEAFEKLGMNPIPVDDCSDEHIPGLYEMLNYV